MKRHLLMLLLAFGALAAGCHTTQPTATDLTRPGWRVRTGQGVWTPRPVAVPIAGELLLATHPDGGSLALFSKPPLELASATRSPSGRWTTRYSVPRARSFSGNSPTPAPHAFWVALPEAAARGLSSASGLRFDPLPNGRWRWSDLSGGGVMEGWLEP